MRVYGGSGCRLVDVGTGVAGDLWRWQRVGVARVHGMEPHWSSAREAQSRVARAGQSDAFVIEHAPDIFGALRRVPGASFDVAAMMFSVQHVPQSDLPELMRQLHRVLARDAAVVMTLPDSAALYRQGRCEDVFELRADGRVEFFLDTPYFHRECAPSAEPILERKVLDAAMRAAGFDVLWRPFTSFPGYFDLSGTDRQISSLYTAVVGLKPRTPSMGAEAVQLDYTEARTSSIPLS